MIPQRHRLPQDSRGFGLVAIALFVALLFGGAMALPKWFNGDRKRAEKSAATTTELVSAKDNQSAEAAASVTKMVEVAATTAPSWQREYLGLEGAVALSYLQKPDPLALARAEARRAAVAEGQRDEARRLYAQESGRAMDADKRSTAALIAKSKSDSELARVAAEREGAEQTRNVMLVVALLAFALWVWTKFTHLSPDAVHELRKDLADIGPTALSALDGVTSRLQQGLAKSLRKKAERKAALAAVNAAE